MPLVPLAPPELHHVGRDDAQVLRDDGQVLPEPLLEAQKESQAGANLPGARLRSDGVARDGPVARESAEVVDAHLREGNADGRMGISDERMNRRMKWANEMGG